MRTLDKALHNEVYFSGELDLSKCTREETEQVIKEEINRIPLLDTWKKKDGIEIMNRKNQNSKFYQYENDKTQKEIKKEIYDFSQSN